MKDSYYGIAGEGWLLVLLLAALTAVLAVRSPHAAALLPGLLCMLVIAKFRDPDRDVPSDPLGVLSPVDGRVVHVGQDDDGRRVLLRVGLFSPYMLRCPVEGRILESNHGLRIRTDEGEEVGMRISGPRWLPSAAVVRYGERIGQGQRCGLLRMARIVEIRLPRDANILVERGAELRAGETVLGHFHRDAPPEDELPA